MATAVSPSPPTTLLDLALACQADPLQYVCCAYSWDEGLLDGETGPDTWQVEILEAIREALLDPGHSGAIRLGVASGHGIGKGALAAWLIQWYMSCRPNPQIVVTANTASQLLTKTWRELAKWHQLNCFRPWFEWTKTGYFKVGAEESWFAAAIPWNESKPEAFQGAHDRFVMVLEDEACHDDQTEVLTEDGWKLFADLSGSERLLTMDPLTEEASYVLPTKLFRAYREGDMCLYQRRGADFCVTPNHRMWHQSWSGRRATWMPWRQTPIADLTTTNSRFARWVNWRAADVSVWTLPAFQGLRLSWPARSLLGDPWMAWLGWYCSEGWLTSFRKAGPYSVGIGNTDPVKFAEIVALTQALGLPYSLHPKSECPTILIHSRQLAVWLAQWGRYSYEKRVPDLVRMASARQIRLFLDAYCAGDGYFRQSGRKILYTSSPAMADDLQECILKAGGISTVLKRSLAGRPAQFDDHIGVSARDGFVVSWQEGRSAILFRQSFLQRVPYRGYVYCAEVPPHHLLLTRRNGYVLWSGNSSIPDIIHDTIEGSMTTPQALWLKCGNPTRNTGRFKEIFPPGRLAHRWRTWQIDSRDCKKTDKAQIAQWVQDYGEDSDFVRVRVRGLFPRVGSTQFIGEHLIQAALERAPWEDTTAAIVVGVDVARYGDDRSVILVRKGPQLLETRVYREKDTIQVAGYVTEVIEQYKPQAVFIDCDGLGVGVYDQVKHLGYRGLHEIHSGGVARESQQCYNKRAEMWAHCKGWLETRAQFTTKDLELGLELTQMEYGYDIKGRLQMERKQDLKARGLASPDLADALCLTFAEYVAPIAAPVVQARQPVVGFGHGGQAWMG